MLLIDGVNEVLSAIGEIEIPEGVDIDSLSPLHEAFQARRIIERISKKIQTRGWWFNEETWTFIPDGVTSKIAVPETVLAIQGIGIIVLKRGNTLYDVAARSLIFTESIDAETTFLLDFEETPDSFAQYIIASAAVEAQWLYKGDKLANEELKESAGIAYIMLDKEHMSNKKYNMITGRKLLDRASNPTA